MQDRRRTAAGATDGVLHRRRLGAELGIRVGRRSQASSPATACSRSTVAGADRPRRCGWPARLFMPLGEADRLFGTDGRINTDPGRARTRGQRRSGPQGALASVSRGHSPSSGPAPAPGWPRRPCSSAELGLQLTSGFSLLLATFIILNTFLMNVGERRRQLAIMRAIGATRSQIVWLHVPREPRPGHQSAWCWASWSGWAGATC